MKWLQFLIRLIINSLICENKKIYDKRQIYTFNMFSKHNNNKDVCKGEREESFWGILITKTQQNNNKQQYVQLNILGHL